MDKRKKVSILLGVLLLLGGAASGTKAWLSNTKDISNDLVITTGTFNLSVDDSSRWVVVNHEDTEINDVLKGNKFINVRPGDIFKKTITITNTGTLKQKLSVKEPNFKIKNIDNSQSNIFDISHNAVEVIDKTVIEPQEKKSFDIEVRTNADKMIKDTHENVNLNFKDIITPITIEGNQTNQATN